MQHFLKKNYKIIITLILGFIFVVSVLNAWWDSAIFDEDAHIPAGYSYVRFHDMRLNPEHPPLIKDLAGIFILPLNPKMDLSKNYWMTDINGQWDAGHDLLWQEGNDADQIIFWGRLPIVILSLIFGLFIFKWVREYSGIIAGLFALVLYSFDPNILGHNHFVTTDLAIAGFMMLSFYYFLRFIKYPTWKNAAVGGIFLGLVQLAKFSSLMLFPVFGLALLFHPFIKKIEVNGWKNRLKTLGEYLGKGAVAFAVSLILVWGVYFVNIYDMPKEKLAETIEYYFPHDDISQRAVLTNKFLLILDKNNVTKPLSEYILGIAMVFKRVGGGNGAYFMGQVSGKSFPAYFPTVFLIKEPLPNLLFMFSAILISLAAFIKFIVSAFRRPLKNVWEDVIHHLRVNVTSVSLAAFIILYSYISVTGNLNIGFRHLFPILPFIYILTAKVIFDFWKKLHSRKNKIIFGSILSILVLLLVSNTIFAYPAYMSYFNQTVGGPKNGYRYVTDSNADWGQDLKKLKAWTNEYDSKCSHNCYTSGPAYVACPKYCVFDKTNSSGRGKLISIDRIHLNYFGGADIKYYFGNFAVDWWDSRRPLESGWYAISTNYLMGSLYDKEKKDSESYRWIENIKPVAQVGTSIFVYYVTEDDLNLVNK
jgi:hypothetical protein